MRRHPTDGNKVFVVWACLVALVIAGMVVAKLVWKEREAERQQAARIAKLERASADVDAALGCLAHGHADLVTGAVADAIAQHGITTCQSAIHHATTQISQLDRTAKREEESRGHAIADALVRLDEVQTLCRWVARIHDDLNALRARAKLPPKIAPRCTADERVLSHVELPPDHAADMLDQIAAGRVLELGYGGKVIARTTDGKSWITRMMPDGYVAHAWTDDGIVVATRDRRGHAVSRLMPLESTVRVPVTQIDWMGRARDVVVLHDMTPSGSRLLRSRDGGKTFERPIAFGTAEDSVRVTLDDDRTVTIFHLSPGPTLAIHRLAPSAKGPVKVFARSWTIPQTPSRPIVTCDRGSRWVIARGILLHSPDGATWTEREDDFVLADRLTCDDDRVAIAHGDDLSVCDGVECKRWHGVMRSRSALRFAGKALELWTGVSDGNAFAVYRIERDKKVLDRVHFLWGEDLRVARDAHGFLALP